MSHLDDGMIQELIDGEIPSKDLPPIQAHLLSCATCTARLDEARDFMATSDELIAWLDEPSVAAPVAPVAPVAVPDIAPRRTVATWPRNVAWAASLMLAVGLGYTARGGALAPIPTTAPMVEVTQSNQAEPGAPAADESGGGAASESRASAPVKQAPSVASTPAPSAPAEQDAASNSARREDVAPDRQVGERETAPPSTRAAEARSELADEAPQARRSRVAAPAAVGAAAGAASNALQPRDQAAAKAVTQSTSVIDSVGVPVGPLFQIEGLDPLRTTLVGDEVRLVYAQPEGEVTLVQRRVGVQVAWHLEVPLGFPAVVLRELTVRVK